MRHRCQWAGELPRCYLLQNRLRTALRCCHHSSEVQCPEGTSCVWKPSSCSFCSFYANVPIYCFWFSIAAHFCTTNHLKTQLLKTPFYYFSWFSRFSRPYLMINSVGLIWGLIRTFSHFVAGGKTSRLLLHSQIWSLTALHCGLPHSSRKLGVHKEVVQEAEPFNTILLLKPEGSKEGGSAYIGERTSFSSFFSFLARRVYCRDHPLHVSCEFHIQTVLEKSKT